MGVKDISDHSIGLALVETSLGPASDDTACILTAVLEERETFTDLWRRLLSRIVENEAADAAHCVDRSYPRAIRGDRTLTLWIAGSYGCLGERRGTSRGKTSTGDLARRRTCADIPLTNGDSELHIQRCQFFQRPIVLHGPTCLCRQWAALVSRTRRDALLSVRGLRHVSASNGRPPCTSLTASK